MPRLRLPLTLLCALLAALALVTTAGAATSTPPHSRIVGGSAAAEGAWPAQGYLTLQRSDGQYACGGSLVSARWFLTAGHCASNADGSVLAPSAFKITLGVANRNLQMSANQFTVDQVQRDPDYVPEQADGGPHSDLALLHISAALPAPALDPLQLVLPSEPALWTPGTSATVVGWGTTCTNCSTTTQLMQANVPIVDDATCGADYAAEFDPATMICAGIGTTDTCQGDSGGPLMVPRNGGFVLAGVTSWGDDCADRAHPGVYARVGAPALNQWIRSVIPTAAISVSPATPQAGEPVTLTASAVTPSGAGALPAGAPTFGWDFNADGVYTDASGPSVPFGPAPAGVYTAAVQATYPDGDRAVDREVVIVAPAPPPPPPPPPPAPTPVPKVKPLARLVNVARRLRISGLLDHRTSVHVQCYSACTMNVKLRLDATSARRLKLTRRTASVQIGAGRARFEKASTAAVTVVLTRTAVRRIATARSGDLTLTVTVTVGSRHQVLSKALTLQR
jgi:secreted trypsin-like serine protease